MNTTVIEAQARYLIEDRDPPRPAAHRPAGVRRRARRVRRLSWL